MKKIQFLALALLAGVLLLAASPVRAQENPNSPDVDGTIWMQTTSAEKRAFLYGAGNALVLEYHIRMKHNEEPSKFIQGWVEVFKDRSWPDLEMALDRYYVNNPDKMKEHVFHVIWNSMIKPNMKN